MTGPRFQVGDRVMVKDTGETGTVTDRIIPRLFRSNTVGSAVVYFVVFDGESSGLPLRCFEYELMPEPATPTPPVWVEVPEGHPTFPRYTGTTRIIRIGDRFCIDGDPEVRVVRRLTLSADGWSMIDTEWRVYRTLTHIQPALEEVTL